MTASQISIRQGFSAAGVGNTVTRVQDFKPKSKRQIFVGYSRDRKGWLCFDPTTFRISTSIHLSFDEDYNTRRSALISYDARLQQGGFSVGADGKKRLALVRELYRKPDTPLEISSYEPHHPDKNRPTKSDNDPEAPHVNDKKTEHKRTARADREQSRRRSARDSAKKTRKSKGRSSQTSRSRGEEDHHSDDDASSSEEEQPPVETPQPPSVDDEGEAIIDASNVELIQIPERRLAIGRKQALSDDDIEYLERAFKVDAHIEYLDKNPKRLHSDSWRRYNKYRSAKTLREAKRLGASWSDILWDFERYYFSPVVGETSQTNAVRSYRAQGISAIPAAVADEQSHAITTDIYSTLTLQESLQVDYAYMADGFLATMDSSRRRLLKLALGGETLTQFAFSCAARVIIDEPLTVEEALASEHADEWQAAINEEVDTLIAFNCFDVVPHTDAIKYGRLVKSKWVFKVKYDRDNNPYRFRARLVAKGFSQKPGLDFDQTYSPVMAYPSLRALLAMAAANDYMMTGYDIKSAFIQQALDLPHMYMSTPPGVKWWEKTVNGEKAALHCLGSIYGLKQSSMLLNKRLTSVLKTMGFEPLISDPSVFTKGPPGPDQQIVACWVDDILFLNRREDKETRAQFNTELESHFVMSEWTEGEADFILNIRIDRDWKAGTIKISQPAAIEKLARKFGLDDIKVTGAPVIPMKPELRLAKAVGDEIVSREEFDYPSIVGSLLYISLTTRPDISTATGILSRFMACPGRAHCEAAKQVVSYLVGTKHMGLIYRRSGSSIPVAYGHARVNNHARDGDVHNSTFTTYADADLANDATTRRSVSGYCIVLHGGIIAWQSKLQTTVSLSTAEAETLAATDACKQIIHFRLFLRELGRKQIGPNILFEDNMAAIALVKNPEGSRASRHYQLKLHFLKNLKERSIFEYRHCTTDLQLADSMTKPTPRDLFTKFRAWMGIA